MTESVEYGPPAWSDPAVVELTKQVQELRQGRIRTYPEFLKELVDLGLNEIERMFVWRTKVLRDKQLMDYKAEIHIPTDFLLGMSPEGARDYVDGEIYKAYSNYLHIVLDWPAGG